MSIRRGCFEPDLFRNAAHPQPLDRYYHILHQRARVRKNDVSVQVHLISEYLYFRWYSTVQATYITVEAAIGLLLTRTGDVYWTDYRMGVKHNVNSMVLAARQAHSVISSNNASWLIWSIETVFKRLVPRHWLRPFIVTKKIIVA